MGRQTKDYSHLIGKTFGDREILNIIRKQIGKLHTACAVCKCKCGRIDDVQIDQLTSGRCLRCTKCADIRANKSTGIKNISYDRSRDSFIVTIKRNGQKVIRHVRSLDEAILTKELLLKHFDEHGCFDSEKLNESCYTQEPKHINVSTRRSRKDYSYLIGQKVGDWTIISIGDLTDLGWDRRIVQLQDEHGYIKESNFKNVFAALKYHKNQSCRAKSNVNIKNISYHKNSGYYTVCVSRNSVKKHGSAKTLEEAIKTKEQFLKEFANEAKAHD